MVAAQGSRRDDLRADIKDGLPGRCASREDLSLSLPKLFALHCAYPELMAEGYQLEWPIIMSRTPKHIPQRSMHSRRQTGIIRVHRAGRFPNLDAEEEEGSVL